MRRRTKRDSFFIISILAIALNRTSASEDVALSKVHAIRGLAPTRPAARGNGLLLLRRAARIVLEALRESRERAAQRIIEDYRRQNVQ